MNKENQHKKRAKNFSIFYVKLFIQKFFVDFFKCFFAEVVKILGVLKHHNTIRRVATVFNTCQFSLKLNEKDWSQSCTIQIESP